MPTKILLVNGPNLNTLGSREPEIYGKQTLADIEKNCKSHAKSQGCELSCFQSNHEGDIIEAIQKACGIYAGLVINPGAFTHTSVAILDALKLLSIPIIEVHLSNIHAREEFRHHSYVSKVATGVICGLGAQGYLMAIDALAARIAGK